MSLRRKVIYALSILIVLTLLGSGITLQRFSSTVEHSHNVIYKHYPAAVNSIELIKDLNQATTVLNDYLLTGELRFKEEFYALKKTIFKKYEDTLLLLEFGSAYIYNHQVNKLGTLFNKFFTLAERLLHLREHELENYPGLLLASTLTDPHTLAYLGLINELISEDYSILKATEKQKLINLLYDLRYSWIQMNNAFRIFMTTRSNDDLENFYNYSAINGKKHKELRSLKIELGFDALDDLEFHRSERLKNAPTVIKMFQSDMWRQDVYVMRTEVYPLLDEAKYVLNSFAQNLNNKLVRDVDEFSNILDNTYVTSGLIIFFLLLLMSFVALVILRGIQPILHLTRFAHEASLDKRKHIDRRLLERNDEVGELAKSFNTLTNDLFEDIKKRKNAEEKFIALLTSAPDATVIINSIGNIEHVNYQAEKLFGYKNEELFGKALELLVPEQFRKDHTALKAGYIQNPTFRPMGREVDLLGLNKRGDEFPIEIALAPIETSDGLLISASIRDVSEKLEVQRKLTFQANFDDLTGLPNRVLAMDRLSHAVSTAHRYQKIVAVLFIDLDNFKKVNDTLGHSTGDKLLLEVAQRLLTCVREGDTVSRLGGDEFLVILGELTDIQMAEIVATKIINHLSSVFQIDMRDLFIGASIGISGYPLDGEQSDILLRNADAAMYQAKYAGKNTFRFFTEQINIQLNRRLEIETQLRVALENKELFLYFQPQYDLATKSIIGAEALLRWENSALGTVPVDEFILVAEETGLINSIGEWILIEACRTAKAWQKIEIQTELRLAVNISAIQFSGGALVQHVKKALDLSGLDPRLLELEITERILLEDNPNSNRIINDLKRVGVRLSLDDFGTGYSSLSYLKRFPFDALKIDRAFVQDITKDEESASLCRAIVAMAQSLNLEVIGEGVETEQQCHFLTGLGSLILQGYYFSPAISNEDFVTFVKNGSKIVRLDE